VRPNRDQKNKFIIKINKEFFYLKEKNKGEPKRLQIALLQNEQSAGGVAQSMRDRSFSGYISTRGRLRSFPPLFQP